MIVNYEGVGQLNSIKTWGRFPFRSLYFLLQFNVQMSDDTSRTYPSGAQEFKSIFSGVHVVCVVFTCFVLCCDICYDLG